MMIGKNILLTGTTVILFLMPLIYLFVWRSKTHAHWKALFIGAAGFIVSARVLELIVHYFCIVSDNLVSRAINGSTPLYVLYGVAMAGIFEEVGRWVILSILNKKINQRKDAIMYGIGHGGIEVWTVTLPVVLTYLMVIASNGSGLPSEMVNALMPSIEAFGFGMSLCFVLERIFCMGIHIALTVMVFYGVQNHEKKYLLKAVVCHMLLDVLPALYQRNVVGLIPTEVYLGACCVILCIFAHKLYKNL
ncbi:MAG: YhfC family glutamic-type intramembrane protease [Lachnospiraceae bacterium]|nr:YhfC family glutamic-type intramembrane protease [Lachnospiraceae bacterium]